MDLDLERHAILTGLMGNPRLCQGCDNRPERQNIVNLESDIDGNTLAMDMSCSLRQNSVHKTANTIIVAWPSKDARHEYSWCSPLSNCNRTWNGHTTTIPS